MSSLEAGTSTGRGLPQDGDGPRTHANRRGRTRATVGMGTRPVPLVLRLAAGHLQPVELLFELVKGVVADLIAGAHVQSGLPRRLKRDAMKVAEYGMGPRVGAGLPCFGSEMSGELPSDGLAHR